MSPLCCLDIAGIRFVPGGKPRTKAAENTKIRGHAGCRSEAGCFGNGWAFCSPPKFRGTANHFLNALAKGWDRENDPGVSFDLARKRSPWGQRARPWADRNSWAYMTLGGPVSTTSPSPTLTDVGVLDLSTFLSTD